jgi:hypothetical protein
LKGKDWFEECTGALIEINTRLNEDQKETDANKAVESEVGRQEKGGTEARKRRAKKL